jgi:hypothetical protein
MRAGRRARVGAIGCNLSLRAVNRMLSALRTTATRLSRRRNHALAATRRLLLPATRTMATTVNATNERFLADKQPPVCSLAISGPWASLTNEESEYRGCTGAGVQGESCNARREAGDDARSKVGYPKWGDRLDGGSLGQVRW